MSISNVARSPLVLCIAVSDSMASVQDRRPRALEAAYAAALLYVDMFPDSSLQPRHHLFMVQ